MGPGELRHSLLTLGRFVTHTPDFDWSDREPGRLSARYADLLARPVWASITLAGMASPITAPRAATPAPRPARTPKTGLNDPCPCGSGKKFKKCCGAPGQAG